VSIYDDDHSETEERWVTLRAAGVSLETRKVLLGHRNGGITSHYSAPEIEELLAAANRVCEFNPRTDNSETKNRLEINPLTCCLN
jgi:hypothetical protein